MCGPGVVARGRLSGGKYDRGLSWAAIFICGEHFAGNILRGTFGRLTFQRRLERKTMKDRKKMGEKIKGCRERGEWAELYFMMLALERDMKLSRPFGIAGRYDVGVESERGVLRVQVKSTIYKRRGDCYSLN